MHRTQNSCNIWLRLTVHLAYLLLSSTIYCMFNITKCNIHTVHSENIQTPSLFLHFGLLQLYSKMDYILFFPDLSTYPIMTKRKNVFRIFGTFITNKKLKYHIYISIQTLCSATQIELRCILFILTILEMFLQLDWSPPVVNSID